MMMSILETGGIPLVTDGERRADDDNPKGYFELERVKKLEGDRGWLQECRGQAIKIVSNLLMHLPEEHQYDVLFMRRKLDEILASQRKMLARRGEPEGAGDSEMKSMFYQHLEEVGAWLEARGNFRVRYVSYNRLLEDPAAEIAKLEAMLGDRFDAAKAKSAVDEKLYRNRK
jgi:hypothetical protein